MKSKVHVKIADVAEKTFNDSLLGIQTFNNNLPVVSKKDKSGSKLTKTMAPLLDKAIENVPLVEKYLPREFDVQNMVDNQAQSKKLQTKITALEREVKRLKNADTCIGIEIAKDYRIIYGATQKAAEDENSLMLIRDQLGKPFEKTANKDAQKAGKVAKNA